MTDETIIALFYKRDEDAIRQCMTQYGSYCKTVASGILTDPADVEEAVADTWLGAWNAIPPKNPTHLRLFLGRITRNLAIDILRRRQAYCRGGGEVTLALHELAEIVGSDSAEAELDRKALAKSISAFLKSEPQLRRTAFIRRYFYLEDIPMIAQQLHRKESAVRMMLSRTRQRLKKHLVQEGYDL